MDSFLRFVADIFEVDVNEINLNIQYGEYPLWDSLMHMRLIMEIEDKYGIEIPIEEYSNIKSLKDLYNRIGD